MGIRRWMKGAPLAALVITAAACGGDDPTGPGSGDPFDPEQSSAAFSAMQTALEGNADVAADLEYVATVLDTLPMAAQFVEPVSVAPATASALVRPVAGTRLAVGFEHVSGSAAALLPADLLGKTFEWDDLEGAYVLTARAGAPSNGIRFIVYDRTTVPPTENGYLDVTDDSDPSADRLGVTLVKDDVTRLDYDIEVTGGTSSATASIAGFVTDGSDRVDFDVTESLVETTDGFRIDVDYSMSLAGEPLSVNLVYSLDFGTAITADFLATFVNGVDTLVLDFSQDAQGAFDGTVEWNGDLVMTVAGDGTADPVFLGPDGEALTPAEAQALQEMFEIASEGLDFLVQYFVFLGGGLA